MHCVSNFLRKACPERLHKANNNSKAVSEIGNFKVKTYKPLLCQSKAGGGADCSMT